MFTHSNDIMFTLGVATVVTIVVVAFYLFVGRVPTMLRRIAGGRLSDRGVRFCRAGLIRSVLNHLSVITNLNLPLAEGLAAAGKGEPAPVGRALRRIGVLTAKGVRLSQALDLAIWRCDPIVLGVVQAGENAGQLPRALADLDAMLARRVDQSNVTGLIRDRWATIGIPVITAFWLLQMVFLLMVFVTPKFMEIFMDFEVELPAATLMLIGLTNWLGRHAPLLLLLLPVLIVLAVLIYRWICRPIAFGQAMAIALRTVSMGLASGMDLQRAVELAADLKLGVPVRHRWILFAKLIESGVPAYEAARSAGLGTVVSWSCRTLARGNVDVDAVLGHAADYHQALADRWWRGLIDICQPVSTCVLGCLVGFIAYAMFSPLVSLIDSVTESIP